MISAVLVYSIALVGLIKKKSRLTTVLLFAICFVLAWMTDDRYDYYYYELGYKQIALGTATRFELCYVALMKLGNILGLDYYQFRGAYSFLMLLLLFCSISKFTTEVNIPVVMGLVFPLLYMFPIQRFLGGAALVLFALRYLYQEKKHSLLKFYMLVFLAGLFHSACFFFLLAPIYKVFRNKNNYIHISLIFCVVFVVLAQQGILNRIISAFPLGDSVINVILNGERANLNGIIAYSIILLLVMIPGFMSVHWYPKEDRSKVSSFMDVVYNMNVLSFYTIAFRVYSIGVTRILYIFMLVNYSAVANTLHKCRRGARNYNVHSLYLVLISAFCLMSCTFLELYVFSPALKDAVFWVQFETNPVFELINHFFGG